MLIAVDLNNGDRREISGSSVGTGPLPSGDPTALAIDGNGILFLAAEGEGGMGALFAVEPQSGDRIVVSR